MDYGWLLQFSSKLDLTISMEIYIFLNFEQLELKNKAQAFLSWSYLSSSSILNSPD